MSIMNTNWHTCRYNQADPNLVLTVVIPLSHADLVRKMVCLMRNQTKLKK